MTRKAIVFDLDDTLISTQRRHHEAYCRIVLLSGKEHPVSFDQYVSFRSKYGYSNAQATKELHDIDEAWSLELWRSIIESNFFLKYDSQIVIDNYLQLAREGHDLYLLSLRANRNLPTVRSILSILHNTSRNSSLSSMMIGCETQKLEYLNY